MGTKCSLLWGPELQQFSFGNEVFSHKAAINTSPTHDLSHLFIACSGLPWRPVGSASDISIVEFNAILLENMLFYANMLYGIKGGYAALDRAKALVLKDYSPFPITWEDAISRFWRQIDLAQCAALSPFWFALRELELKHGQNGPIFRLDFDSDEKPTQFTDRAIDFLRSSMRCRMQA